MKLRLETGNFKVVGIVTQTGPVNKISFNKLPAGLDSIDFLGVIVEIRGKVPSFPVTYSEIGEATCPTIGPDDLAYDDVIVINLSSSNAGIQLFYNKTTGDIGTDFETISNKSESSDSTDDSGSDDSGSGGGGDGR